MTSHDATLFVAWRRAEGLIVPVGRLTQTRDEVTGERQYEFVYLKRADGEEGFVPLPGLPDLHTRYTSMELFPVFENRIMPRSRPDYERYLGYLDLNEATTDPFYVLERSEGRRATDRVEVFPVPRRAGDELTTVFFVRGIRHMPGAEETAATLVAGDLLDLVPEPGNPVNPRALLLNTRTGGTVGWVPDYLIDLVDDLRRTLGDQPRIIVEHVNGLDTPPHLRVLCRLTSPWPEQFEPFSGPDFQPMVHAAP